jgi:hypothetical protein
MALNFSDLRSLPVVGLSAELSLEIFIIKIGKRRRLWVGPSVLKE